MATSPRALASRLHDNTLQLLGFALLRVELCEQLLALDRGQEVPARLGELRGSLEQATAELRQIMADLRAAEPAEG
jgi:signal transduction histidine kinase